MLTRDGGQNRAQILGAKIGPSLVFFGRSFGCDNVSDHRSRRAGRGGFGDHFLGSKS